MLKLKASITGELDNELLWSCYDEDDKPLLVSYQEVILNSATNKMLVVWIRPANTEGYSVIKLYPSEAYMTVRTENLEIKDGEHFEIERLS